jgi:hypothetical protein
MGSFPVEVDWICGNATGEILIFWGELELDKGGNIGYWRLEIGG